MPVSRRAVAMWRDAALVAALAVVTVQSLRRWFGDRYLVPSGSMEPVFHGDPRHGDVVFVGKLASAAARRRHDLVVVRHPTEPGQQMVKRIAARGDDADACCIDIRQGDVWLGPDPQRMQREQKDPLVARGQRALWASEPGGAASRGAIAFGPARKAQGSTTWHLPGNDLSLATARTQLTRASRLARQREEKLLPDGFLGAARPLDAGFLDATGARGATGADVAVTDVGMELAFEQLPGVAGVAGDVLATIETRNEALTFHWQPSTGRVVLWRDGADVTATTLPVLAAPASLEFGLLDDRAWFCVDGRRDSLFVVARAPEWNGGHGAVPPPGPRSLVWIGTVGGAAGSGLAITRIRLFHDVYAWREPILGMPGQAGSWPRTVPIGHWFLLGDSAFDSHDSRQFGTVPAASFLGLPCAVIGPWPRTRWVSP